MLMILNKKINENENDSCLKNVSVCKVFSSSSCRRLFMSGTVKIRSLQKNGLIKDAGPAALFWQAGCV